MEAELNFWLQIEFQIRDYLKTNIISRNKKRNYMLMLREIDEILEYIYYGLS